jgi:hypothetical protein
MTLKSACLLRAGNLQTEAMVYLISNFRRVLNMVCILLGISPAYQNLTPGKYPKEYTKEAMVRYSL